MTTRQTPLEITMNPIPVYMTQRELCQLIQVTPNTMRLWQNRGWIEEPRRVGIRVVYDLATVRAGLARNCLRANMEAIDAALAAAAK